MSKLTEAELRTIEKARREYDREQSLIDGRYHDQSYDHYCVPQLIAIIQRLVTSEPLNAPRESAPKAVESVPVYVYGTINRPAGYGTIPDGYLPDSLVDHQLSDSQPYFSSISYSRKLTAAELYKYEMAPISSNAFDFQIGDRVIADEVDKGDVVALRTRNRYDVRLDFSGTIVNYHASNLVAEPVSDPTPPTPFAGAEDIETDRDYPSAKLSPAQHGLLLLLNQQDYTISRVGDLRNNGSYVRHIQASTVDVLRKKGLIEPRDKDEKKIRFIITESGRAALKGTKS